MADLNKVTLVGRLVRDPELKKTNDGSREFCTFAVAVQGNTKNKTNFIDCVCGIENQVKTLTNGKWFLKGTPIALEGELNQSSFKDKDGNIKSVTRVNVRSVFFVPQSKKEAAAVENIDSSKNGDLPF